jgi:hypothetical protein
MNTNELSRSSFLASASAASLTAAGTPSHAHSPKANQGVPVIRYGSSPATESVIQHIPSEQLASAFDNIINLLAPAVSAALTKKIGEKIKVEQVNVGLSVDANGNVGIATIGASAYFSLYFTTG